MRLHLGYSKVELLETPFKKSAGMILRHPYITAPKVGVMGMYRDNGKEKGSYYSGSRVSDLGGIWNMGSKRDI